MPLASGTSLTLIALNALVALLAVGHWPSTSLTLGTPLAIGGVAGGRVGQQLGQQLSERRLRQGFSVLLVVTTLLSGMEAWRRQPGPTAKPLPSDPLMPEE